EASTPGTCDWWYCANLRLARFALHGRQNAHGTRMGSKVAPRAWIPDVRFLRSCALIRLRRSEFAQRKRREAHQFRDELLSALWAPGFVDRQCSDIVVPFMRICFVVDYRSPIARNWLDFFIAGEHEVHVISTHGATAPVPRPATLHCV